jgi:lipopolysaccharide biosynthesis regulator YciM
LVTRTLAELYVKQGLIGKARAIYRRLAEQGDETARQRLLELPSSKARIEALEALLEQVRRRRKG